MLRFSLKAGTMMLHDAEGDEEEGLDVGALRCFAEASMSRAIDISRLSTFGSVTGCGCKGARFEVRMSMSTKLLRWKVWKK